MCGKAFDFRNPDNRISGYVISFVIVAAVTALDLALADYVDHSNLMSLYLLGVVWAAYKCGRGPSIFASVISVLAFDYFFVGPKNSFSIAEAQYAITLFVMLLVSLLIARPSSMVSALRKKEEMLYQKQRDFTSSLAHDIRTSAAGMGQMLELLVLGKIGNLQPLQDELLEKMLQANKRQVDRLETLLQVSHYEEQEVELEYQDVELKDLIKSCVDEMNLQARALDIKVNVDVSDDVPKTYGNAESLKRLVKSLLDNAFRFSPNGSSIYISARNDNHVAEIRIQDHGPGISVDDQKKLFTGFWYGSQNGPSAENVGMGLYLAHKIAKAHGGEIACVSKLGEGSTFIVTLPVLKVPAAANANVDWKGETASKSASKSDYQTPLI